MKLSRHSFFCVGLLLTCIIGLCGSRAIIAAVMPAAPVQFFFTDDPSSTTTLVTSQPLPTAAKSPSRSTHLYVGRPETGEIAYLNSYAVLNAEQALRLLNLHAIDGPAHTAGFRALVPDQQQVSWTLSDTNGVMTVNLPKEFPVTEQWRLAGLLLTATQFSATRAVQFRLEGKPLVGSCYGADLAGPISPSTLRLPNAKVGRQNGFPIENIQTLPLSYYSPLGSLSPDKQYRNKGMQLYNLKENSWLTFDCWYKEHQLSQVHASAWVPDEKHTLIVEVGDQAEGEARGDASFCQVTPELPHDNQVFLRMSSVLEWRVLPDKSGLVILRSAATKPGDGAGWSERSELLLYTFADENIQQLFFSPWISGDMSHARALTVTGEILTRQMWASYSVGSDPQIRYAINLANKNMVRRELPAGARISPDNMLLATNGKVSSYQPENGIIVPGHYNGQVEWSADSKWLLSEWGADSEGRRDDTFTTGSGNILYRVDTTGVHEYFRMNGYVSWGGNDLLLIHVPHENYEYVYLRSPQGGPDRLIYRVQE